MADIAELRSTQTTIQQTVEAQIEKFEQSIQDKLKKSELIFAMAQQKVKRNTEVSNK